MQNRVKNAELYFIEKTGHEVNVKAPKELADLIDKFWINDSQQRRLNDGGQIIL